MPKYFVECIDHSRDDLTTMDIFDSLEMANRMADALLDSEDVTVLVGIANHWDLFEAL
jgi:hypothetical protein